MKLSGVMNRNVEVITGDTSVREAAQRMRALDVGALPVCTDDRIMGVVTDRDLVVRSIACGDDPDKTPVSEAVTSEVESCYEDETVEDAARRMSARQIQRLLVMSRDERLVGIVSLADLARARGNGQAATRLLERIKAPTKLTAAGARRQRLNR